MFQTVRETYRQIENARPLVRPAYNQLEVDLLPPFGDPEVDLVGEVGTYLVVGLLANAAVELADEI